MQNPPTREEENGANEPRTVVDVPNEQVSGSDGSGISDVSDVSGVSGCVMSETVGFSRVRYEYWNGQTSKKKKYVPFEGLVTTKHNPCLWTTVGATCDNCLGRRDIGQSDELPKDVSVDVDSSSIPLHCSCKPWRKVHTHATQALTRWENEELNDSEFLHHLRYVAYGIGKRDFDDEEVVWPGNLTANHRPKLSVEREILKQGKDIWEDGANASDGECFETFTVRFVRDEGGTDATSGWKALREDGATFYWDL